MRRVLVAAALVAAPALASSRAGADRPAPPASIAVVFVIEGHTRFMRGDPDFGDDGRYAALQLALDTVAEQAPPDSLGALVTYGQGARVRRAMGPLSTLTGDNLGELERYDEIARDLAAGVDRAVDLVLAAPAAARVIVIVGDGADTDVTQHREALRELRVHCDAEGIEVYAVNHSVDLGQELAVIDQIAPGMHQRVAAGVIDLVPSIRRTFRQAVDDATAAAAAPPPGPERGPPSGSGRPPRVILWAVLALGVAVGAVGVVALLRRRTRVA